MGTIPTYTGEDKSPYIGPPYIYNNAVLLLRDLSDHLLILLVVVYSMCEQLTT